MYKRLTKTYKTIGKVVGLLIVGTAPNDGVRGGSDNGGDQANGHQNEDTKRIHVIINANAYVKWLAPSMNGARPLVRGGVCQGSTRAFSGNFGPP
jgi:hypothetical protein